MSGCDVLVVDDDPLFAEALADYLRGDGLAVRVAGSLAAGRRLLEEEPRLLILDQRLPDGDGLELADELGPAAPERCRVLVVTAHPRLDDAVASLRLGIDDYLTKPIDLEVVRHAVLRSLDTLRLERLALLERRRRTQEGREESLVGDGLAELRRLIERVGPAQNPVLISGETGTGKSLAARELHRAGGGEGGGDRPFVKVNCAALPASLVESELFGVERGAFTGADASRPGLFELADGGTLFLDEIGELEPAVQAKLLAALDDGQARRVGGRRPVPFSVRVVAATNADLAQAVEEGSFRNDLFYRLSVVRLHIPPLRQRSGDLPDLCRALLARLGMATVELPPGELARLAAHPWPGNVRELLNTLERAVLLQSPPLAPSRLLPAAAAPPPDGATGPVAPPGEQGSGDPHLLPSLAEVERRHIERVLAACGGHRTRAAEVLGIGIATLHRRLRSYRSDPI